jgi:menaquinone-dependent protoporphyrinogen oxidase
MCWRWTTSLALASELLQAAGARVTTAHSADEALERLAAHVPTVLVADLGMPHVDGFRLLDRVRHHPNELVRRIPAAALTAFRGPGAGLARRLSDSPGEADRPVRARHHDRRAGQAGWATTHRHGEIVRAFAAMQASPTSMKPPRIVRRHQNDEDNVHDAADTMTQVLIGYASRFGSTRDIAGRIAKTLEKHGLEVDLRAVSEISHVDRYDAVVFGSGVYDGSWTAEATAFARRHASLLAARPLWLFSVGSFGDSHPVVGGLIKKEPKEIGEFEQALHPRDYRVFAGVIDLHHWPAWGRILFKALGGRDGDNRQWSDVDAWAAAIGQELRPPNR